MAEIFGYGPAHRCAHTVRAHIRTLSVFASIALLSACGGDSPTAPTPQIPNVVGSYTGTITVTLPEVPASRDCPASTSVTQSGSTVSVAPIVLGGTCGNLSLPVGQQTIDATGAFTGPTTGTFFEPSCGGNYTYTASGGFFGRELRISMTATSAICLNFNFTAVLTR